MLALSVFFVAAHAAIADTVSLNNGDKITGTIKELTAASVIVETPYAGRLTIDRAAIKTMHSEKPVSIAQATGPAQEKYVSPNPGDKGWQETAAYVPPPPATPPRHTSYLSLGPNWKNQFALGVTNTTGNDESTAFASSLSFNYLNKPDEFNLKLEGVYGVSNGTQNAGLFAQTAVYRHDLTKKLFWYVDDDIRYDAIKGISLQATATIGLGYKLVDTEKFKLDIRGGPGVTYLKTFDGNEEFGPAASAGIRAQYVFNERISLTHEDVYTTSLSDLDIWRIHSETALNLKIDIESGLGLKLSFNDDYENQPSAGRKNNDTRAMLSLTLDF
jgi:putative salt-induced outer membrane protein YdiY